jgi:Flp pilus assembly protein TadG
MKRMKHIGRGQRGQSVLEMALVTLVLVAVAAGAADLGRAMHTWIIIHNAAREGARYASKFPLDDSEIIAHAEQEMAESGVDSLTHTITVQGLDRTEGNPIRVDIVAYVPTIVAPITNLGMLELRSSNEMIIFGTPAAGP